MSDQVLNILKLSLLGLVYLFFARVLWAVWSEVKTPRGTPGPATPDATATQPVSPSAATVPQPRPVVPPPQPKRAAKPPKGRGGRAARLVILEPKHRRGMAVAIDREITLGRDDELHDHDPGRLLRLHAPPQGLRLRRSTDGRRPRLDQRHLPQRQPPPRLQAAATRRPHPGRHDGDRGAMTNTGIDATGARHEHSERGRAWLNSHGARGTHTGRIRPENEDTFRVRTASTSSPTAWAATRPARSPSPLAVERHP